jgi:CCR4-Not complex component, Not1
MAGRYHFLSAIANQLRYPNSHTYYFSCVVLELFSQEDAPPNTYEQITRVLLERIVCNRPHPVTPHIQEKLTCSGACLLLLPVSLSRTGTSFGRCHS